MIYTLKNYQRIAVDKLKKRINLFLEEDSYSEIVFKSPTGSGKTFMAASLIEEICEENFDTNFCVIWACPGNGELHKQSFTSVKKYLGGNPHCSLLEDDFFGTRKYIKNKEIVFVNWEKLIQKDKKTDKWVNNLMRDQEGMNFIDVIDYTKKNGTKIILIVDESHIGSSHKTRIQEFKQLIIVPNIVVEMSATPISEHIDVEVASDDVIEQGMIKKDVIVNEGISKNDRSLSDKDSETLILEQGYKKRLELLERFKQIGTAINPLVLIQIPNEDAGEAKKTVIKDFLREKGITEENGKLLLWCDEYASFDKEELRKNNNITEFVVFKTAIATGWDCPRAHILIKFRDGKSETFEIQTIGRILRTPEAKAYDDDLLDNAYIYTNIINFETKADTYNPNRIKTEFSKMRDDYTKISIWESTKLISYYRSRQGDYNSADSNFLKYMISAFKDYFDITDEDCNSTIMKSYEENFLKKGLNLSIKGNDSMMEETIIDSKTIDTDQNVNSELIDVKMSEDDIQSKYYALIKRNLNGLAYVRSKSPINSAIIECFSEFYNVFPRNSKVINIQTIVVNNETIFDQILNTATMKFRDSLIENAGKKGITYDFKIESIRAYSIDTHTILPSKKSLYEPLYVLKDAKGNVDNQLEKDFLSYLDNSNEVEWFWENGTELMQVNFGIPYNNGLNTFQPDFIVKFKNGVVGIFDTKPINYRVEDTKIKAEALYQYLNNINFNRGYAPKIIGGIVIKSGTQFYVYNENVYQDYAENALNWVNFNDLIFKIKNNIDL